VRKHARQTVRREGGKAASVAADATRTLRDWFARHRPWRNRNPLSRLWHRAADAAHRA
jgi:hypothetical protein